MHPSTLKNVTELKRELAGTKNSCRSRLATALVHVLLFLWCLFVLSRARLGCLNAAMRSN